MKTYSLERLILDALHDAKAVAKYVAALAFAPVIDAVYPPLGSGIDLRDGAEQLAEAEAEEEVAELRLNDGKTPFDPQWKMTVGNVSPYQIPDETPNPTEPSLSDDELIAVRGLIQERYEGKPVMHLGRPKHGTQQTSAVSASADSGEAVSASPPAPASPPLTTDAKYESCLCGEQLTVAGAEAAVLQACADFRDRHRDCRFDAMVRGPW